MWLSLAAGFIAIPAAAAWAWVTQPESRVVTAVLAVLMIGALVLLVLRRTWLDTQHGLLVREVLFVLRRPAAWADAEVVRFTDNRVGQLMLEVRGPGRRRRRTCRWWPWTWAATAASIRSSCGCSPTRSRPGPRSARPS